MIGVAVGRVHKSGDNWFLLAEKATNKSGEDYEKRYMCGVKKGGVAPPEGAYGIAQGFVYAQTREHDGKTYADLKMAGASFEAISTATVKVGDAPAFDPDDPEIPF